MRRDDYAKRPHYVESEGECASSSGEIIDDWTRSGNFKSNGNDRRFARTEIPLSDRRGQIDDGNAFDPVRFRYRASRFIVVRRRGHLIEDFPRHDDPRSTGGTKEVEATGIAKEDQR